MHAGGQSGAAMILQVDPPEVALPRGLVRARRVLALVALVVVGAELFRPIATWPEEWIAFAFYLYRAGWIAVLVLAVVFWRELFRFARAAGGTGYAAAHVVLSVLLTPVAGLGILLVPSQVAADVASGRAAWRRERALGLGESVLRTALYLLALLALALPLWLLEPRLALAAPVAALFLQRLVLPRVLSRVRRARGTDDGAA